MPAPVPPHRPGLDKTGAYNASTGSIDWVITVIKPVPSAALTDYEARARASAGGLGRLCPARGRAQPALCEPAPASATAPASACAGSAPAAWSASTPRALTPPPAPPPPPQITGTASLAVTGTATVSAFAVATTPAATCTVNTAACAFATAQTVTDATVECDYECTFAPGFAGVSTVVSAAFAEATLGSIPQRPPSTASRRPRSTRPRSCWPTPPSGRCCPP